MNTSHSALTCITFRCVEITCIIFRCVEIRTKVSLDDTTWYNVKVIFCVWIVSFFSIIGTLHLLIFWCSWEFYYYPCHNNSSFLSGITISQEWDVIHWKKWWTYMHVVNKNHWKNAEREAWNDVIKHLFWGWQVNK